MRSAAARGGTVGNEDYVAAFRIPQLDEEPMISGSGLDRDFLGSLLEFNGSGVGHTV